MTSRAKRAQGATSGPRLSWRHAAVIAVGLIAATLNFVLLTDRGSTTSVAVVTAEIPAGSVLSPSDLRLAAVEIPDDALGFLVTDLDSVVGRVAGRTLAEGAMLSRADLLAPAAPGALRAYAIPLTPDRAVAGALVPGDRVDVVGADDEGASYLAVDLEVLAVQGGEGGIGISGFSVTVAVDAETALSIASALESETVSLVRSTGAPANPLPLSADVEEASGDA